MDKQMTVRELEIIKVVLEGDIIRQKKTIEEIKDERLRMFELWLEDSEKLLKKVSRRLFYIKGRKQLFKK